MAEFNFIEQMTIKCHNFLDNEGKAFIKGNYSIAEYCRYIANYGVDGLYITENSETDEEHDENIDTIKEIVTIADTKVYLAGNIKRLEDVKKYLYAGAEVAVLDFNKESNVALLKEACDRFGKDKIGVYFDDTTSADDINNAIAAGVKILFAKNIKAYSTLFIKCSLKDYNVVVLGLINDYPLIKEVFDISKETISGIAIKLSEKADINYMKLKKSAKNDGIPAKTLKPVMSFSDFKTNDDGLIPVIVQDYKTDEVLMLAYMNEEAFEHTMETGRMTYYSRSRDELWEKGLTSGHFQYVKSISADCDNDTLLAKVFQVGAACHTGKRSCFFNEVLTTEYKENNPHKILDNVFEVILDRKENPKEGSYTNYLFDKGIDKILKKVGEEATEIIIAAKNPNPEEIKYEISDFLYHVMVLMAEKNVTWEDIMTELSRR